MGPGIDVIAHFDQQGDIITGAETRIQAKNGGYGRGIGGILVLETLQTGL